MNPEELNKQIIERFRELPPKVQQAITSTDLPKKIKDLVLKHNLLLDEGGILEREILFVLLGLEPSSDFVGNLSSELKLDKGEVQNIASDVNTSIFDEVRVHLRQTEDVPAQEEKPKEKEKFSTNFAPQQNHPVTRESLKKDMEDMGGITIHDDVPHQHTEKEIEAPINLPGSIEIVGMTDPHTDAIDGHLIAAGKTTPHTSADPVSRENSGAGDPYREAKE